MKAAEKIGTRMQVGLIQEEKLFQAPAYQAEPFLSRMWSIRLRTGIRSPTEGYAMLKEYHYDHLIRWPRGERAAVFLTFDFQGGEDHIFERAYSNCKTGDLDYPNCIRTRGRPCR